METGDEWPEISRDDWIVVPNWDEFQHYRRDRGRPVWIKVYTRLLQNPDYLDLTLAARGLLHGIWLSYAQRGGVMQVRHLGLLVRMRGSTLYPQLVSLNHAGFIEFSASKPLAQKLEVEEETPLTPLTGNPAQALLRRAADMVADWEGGTNEEFHAQLDALERVYEGRLPYSVRHDLWELARKR